MGNKFLAVSSDIKEHFFKIGPAVHLQKSMPSSQNSSETLLLGSTQMSYLLLILKLSAEFWG